MKKILTIAVAVALLVGVTALAYGKGPVAKATGGVELEVATGPDQYTRHASFNAHEYAPGQPAKGKFVWTQRDTITNEVHKIFADVIRVAVSGNTARFVCLVTSATTATNIGRKLYIHVEDHGSPGAGTDVFKLSWVSPTFANVYNVIGGNLVVH